MNVELYNHKLANKKQPPPERNNRQSSGGENKLDDKAVRILVAH